MTLYVIIAPNVDSFKIPVTTERSLKFQDKEETKTNINVFFLQAIYFYDTDSSNEWLIESLVRTIN